MATDDSPPPDDEAWTGNDAPDASAAPEGLWADDDVWGGEAAVSAHGDVRPIDRRGDWFSSRGDDTADPDAPLREMERRMETGRTPVYPLDTRRRLPMEFVWKRWRALAMRGRADVVDDFGRDPIATARWEWVLDFLYSRWFRVEARGVEHVPSTGPVLLVANHAGSLPYDSAMVMHAIRRDHRARRDVRPLVEDAVFHLPWLGPLVQRIGGVRACPENAERLIDQGEVVAVFPEGIKGMSKLWRDRYRLQRFGRGGFIKLALRTRAPIIPVAVVGSEEALPLLARVTWFAKSVGIPYVPVTPTFPWLGPLGLVPLPSKWKIEFGAPLDLAAEYGPEAADDRLLVGRLSEQVRAQVQAMVDGLRGHRPRP
ncbi:MAG TPA: lysophospholipid acyltransferase family protein [Kofleriaceae bacterium]|nr:lysophospholipid acyltransferase family protein [Kofleriaceae bacterium]